MLVKKMILWFGLAAAATVGVVAGFAPPPTNRGASKEQLLAELRASGKTGEDLANAAIHAVSEAVHHHSVWHLWETPETAVSRGRGWSHQYNTVLARILEALGFDVELVHAARVRGFGYPWYMSGHTWVKVTIAGRRYDACASRLANSLGEVPFIPVTTELPLRVQTRIAVPLALSPFVIWHIWKSWILHRPLPEWLFGERHA